VTDPVTDAARSAAAILAPGLDPNLPTKVEAVLAARRAGEQRPEQYDPVAIASIGIGTASLIVSITQLAWSIVSDQRKQNAQPPPDAIARQVRIKLRQRDIPMPSATDHITDVVIAEVIRLEGPPR